jgi:hypothetical protein
VRGGRRRQRRADVRRAGESGTLTLAW